MGEFQFAQFFDEDYDSKKVEMNKLYLAPELIEKNLYFGYGVELSDLFSLGIIFYELLFEKQLFNIASAKNRTTNRPIVIEAQQTQLVSNSCMDLLLRML